MSLGLAGRVPDELLTLIRGMLAAEAIFELPRTVIPAVVALEVPLTAGDVALLREVESQFYGSPDPDGVERVPITAEIPATGHRFEPGPGGSAELERTGDLLDVPLLAAGLDDASLRMDNPADQALMADLPFRGDVLSIARTLRLDADDRVRVVLVEVAEPAPAWEIAAETMRDLAWDGVVDPQVEVFWTGMDLPPYHRAALAGATVLWRLPA